MTSGMQEYLLLTMKEKNENPFIRVTAQTRKDFQILAAHSGETMLEGVARLAQQEGMRRQKGGQDAQDV